MNFIDDADTEDDVITNPKDIYKKVEDFHNNGYSQSMMSKGGSMMKNSRIENWPALTKNTNYFS